MNMLSTKDAAQNIDNLIAASRMTRQEHIALQQSLELLRMKALEYDEQEQLRKEEEAKEVENTTDE